MGERGAGAGGTSASAAQAEHPLLIVRSSAVSSAVRHFSRVRLCARSRTAAKPRCEGFHIYVREHPVRPLQRVTQHAHSLFHILIPLRHFCVHSVVGAQQQRIVL
jgi:hypothetical protein